MGSKWRKWNGDILIASTSMYVHRASGMCNLELIQEKSDSGTEEMLQTLVSGVLRLCQLECPGPKLCRLLPSSYY